MAGVRYNASNRFKAPCAICGKLVPAGLGILGGAPGAWTVHCQECHNNLKSAKPIIRFNAILSLMPDDRVGVSLDRQVTNDTWGKYKTAVTSNGFLFDPTANTNIGDMRAVPELLDSLQHAGFDVIVDAKLANKLQEKAAEAREDVEESGGRADFVDTLLAKRGQKLYPFQRKTIDWLAPRTTALLAHEMGLGKTICALVSLAEKAPVLIITPAVAKRTWLRETCNFRPDYGTCRERTRAGLVYLEPDKGITILEGRDSFVWPKPGEIVITNYDVLPLTPAEHDDAKTLLSEWESRGRPEEFSWIPPQEGDGEGEEEDVTMDDIKAAERLAEMKPVTPPPKGCVLIADEGHIIRVRKARAMSNRARRFRAVAEYVRATEGRTWILTGTPLLNEPSELWSVLLATGCANQVFGSRKQFDKHFIKKSDGTWQASSVVPKLLQRCMFRYRKRGVLTELPPKTREHVQVKIAPGAKEELDELLRVIEEDRKARFEDLVEAEREKAEKEEEKRRAAAAAKKKRKKDVDVEEDEEEEDEVDAIRRAQEIATEKSKDYIKFDEISRIRSILANAKIPATLKLVQEYVDRNEPVVVFADHIAPVEAIYEKFGREAGGWALITGTVTAKKRAAIEESFQRGKLNGIAATIGSSGVALTLTRANHALFVEETWTPALNLQAQDRIYRIGQFRPVSIRILVADHVMDEHIARVNKQKIELIEATVEKGSMDPNAEVVTDADAFKKAAELAKESVRREEEAKKEAEIFEAMERDRPDLLKPVASKPVVGGAGPSRTPTGGVVLPVGPTGTMPVPSAPTYGGTQRFQARNALEQWAGNAIKYLAACDQDRACVVNAMGFSKFDGEFGHSLASQLDRGLSDKQWAAAIKMAQRYRRQVGDPPSGSVQRNPPGSWHVVMNESQEKGELGMIGNDDIKARMIPWEEDMTISRLYFPKALYEPEECAEWANAHNLPWLRVEG